MTALLLVAAGVTARASEPERPGGEETRAAAVIATQPIPTGGPNLARVQLPHLASEAATIQSDNGVEVVVRMRGAAARELRPIGNISIAGAALGDAHVAWRAGPAGAEDFVYFARPPQEEVVRYDVDTSRVPGLRMVGGTLELLDGTGTPRLRVPPPYVIDANGKRLEATLGAEDCAFDASPAPPWGRAVTSPGAHCTVSVRWHAAAYPVLVDPQWVSTGAMAVARTSHTATLLPAGKVLIAGGSSTSGVVASAELYDPTTKTFAMTGSMAAARTQHAASSPYVNGDVLICGGSSPSNDDLQSAELYHPALGTFTSTGSMTLARSTHTATTYGMNNVLVIGLETGTAHAERYDFNVGTFSSLPIPTARHTSHSATLLANNKILVSGGGISGDNVHELFDIATSTFAEVTEADKWFGAPGVRLASGKVLIPGGHYGINAQKRGKLFDPATNTFGAAPDLAVQRELHTANLLPSGAVLVIGGFSGASTPLASTEGYDPATNVFTSQPPLAVARGGHTATSLSDGTVVVVGGTGTGGAPLTSAESITYGGAGVACTSAATCASGFCVDGVCCNVACTGTCEACDIAGSAGICSGVSGAPHGGRTCDGAGACAGKCDGTNVAACAYPAAETACGGTCAVAVERPSTCDGHGACKEGLARSCSANLACDGDKCRTKCAVDGDCAAGFSCSGDGRCLVPASCTDKSTSTNVSGVATDCAPYLCDTTGQCKSTCRSVDECVTGAVCSPDAHCQPSLGNDIDSGGGCALVGNVASGDASSAVWLLLLFARRRARSRS